MASWVPFKASGIALFPYESALDNHLKLVCGDELQILQKSGEWCVAKCLTTSCIGICPLTYIQVDGSTEKHFDLLEYEAKEVIKYVFNKHLTPATYHNENFYKYIDLIQRFNRNLPITSSNRQKIANYLDEFREISSLPKVARTDDGCVLRSHDLTLSNFFDTAQKTSDYEPSVSIAVSLKPNYPKDMRVTPLLYDTTKNEVLTEPFDIILTANKAEEMVTFLNIDASAMKDIALVLQFYKATQYDNTYIYEYIGWSAEKLDTPNREFKTGHLIEFSSNIVVSQNVANSELSIQNLVQKADKVHDTGVSVQLFINAHDTNGPAQVIPGTIGTLKAPSNADYNYKQNSVIINQMSLKLPKKISRLRMSVRLLNNKTNKWVENFSVSPNKDAYFCETFDQISAAVLHFKESVQISLGDDSQLDDCSIVFVFDSPPADLTQQTPISPLYYAVAELSHNNILNIGTSEAHLRGLPNDDSVDVDDILKSISENNFKKMDKKLDFNIDCKSTIHTQYQSVINILKLKPTDDIKVIKETLETIDSVPSPTFDFFMHKFFTVICKIIASGDKDKKSVAVKSLITMFLIIDSSRSERMKRLFDEYLSEMFVEENKYLAEVHELLLLYVEQSFPETYDNPEDEQAIKVTSRCLSYILSFVNRSLELSKQLKQRVDKTKFSKSLRNIFNKLSRMMICTKPVALINKSFVIRFFPVLCDIIHSALSPTTSADLAIFFITSIADDVNPAVIKLRYKMYRELCMTKFFHSEEVREIFLPFLVGCLQEEIKKDKECFQTDIYPTIVTLFFVLMKSSSNFSSSFGCLTPFISLILKDESNYTFLVTMIYFADFNFVVNIIKESKKPTETFTALLTTIRKVIIAKPPSYIFFISALVFVEVIKLTKVNQLYIHFELADMVDMVSGFCTDFLSELGHTNQFDQAFFKRLYAVDLSPVVAQLPSLLKGAPPTSRFRPDVLLPLFHLYLIQKDEATREQVTDGFFLVVQTDWMLKKDFKHSEPAILNALQALSVVSDVAEIRLLFKSTYPRFEQHTMNNKVNDFFTRINKMVDYFVDLSKYPNERQYEDERVIAVKGLMDISASTIDFNLYLIFANELCELHMSMKNKVEAAEVMMMVAEKLDFNDKKIHNDLFEMKKVSGRHLKKNLYRKAADLFMEAQFYERAIDALNELHKFHLEDDEDYESLAIVAKKLAQCIHNTVQERTQMNRFYGARFHGDVFNETLRDKVFIYRRDGFFMNDAMLNELSQKFPDVNVTPKIPEDEGKPYIYVFNVKPNVKQVTNFNPLIHQSEYLKSQLAVTKFISEQPVRIRLKEKVGEFAEWHMRIIHYTIDNPLQGIVRRSEVIHESKPKMLSPIENAINSLNQKSFELLQTAASFWRRIRLGMKVDLNTSLFLMTLNGIVNAAVNGGTKVYTDIFLDKLKDDPNNKMFSNKFRRAVADQMRVVKFAIHVHAHVMSNDMAGLQALIETNFRTMEKELEEGPIGPVDYSLNTVFGPMPSLDILTNICN